MVNVCLHASSLVRRIGELVDRIAKGLGKCIICRLVHDGVLVRIFFFFFFSYSGSKAWGGQCFFCSLEVDSWR